jgi:cAMP phosphodiesterase
MASSNLSPESVVVVARDQLSADVGEELVILNTKNEVYYGLQGVGVLVWRKIQQQPRRIAELRDAILEEFEVEPERCERDLMELVTKLLEEGLIELRRHATA